LSNSHKDGLSFDHATHLQYPNLIQNKAELEELALVEADLANLEWKVDEIGVRLNAQIERNHGSTSDSSNKPRQISNQERKLYVYHYPNVCYCIFFLLFLQSQTPNCFNQCS